MVLKQKKKNRTIKFVLSSLVIALAMVLTFSFRSNAKADIFNNPYDTLVGSGIVYTDEYCWASINPCNYLVSSSGSYNQNYLIGQSNNYACTSGTSITLSALTFNTQPFSSSYGTFNSLLVAGSKANLFTFGSSNAYNPNLVNGLGFAFYNIFGKGTNLLDFTDRTDIFDGSLYSSLINHIQIYYRFDNFEEMWVYTEDNLFSQADNTLYLYILPFNANTGFYPNASNTTWYPRQIGNNNLQKQFFIPLNYQLFDSDNVYNDSSHELCDIEPMFSNGFTLDIYFKKPIEYSNTFSYYGIGWFSKYQYTTGNIVPKINYACYCDYIEESLLQSPRTYMDGYNAGVDSVDTTSYYNNGYDVGYQAGVDSVNITAIATNSYNAGYNAGLLNSSHDYGIRDLLYSIFDVPINVLSNLFSFTIFGANVWAVIVSLLAISVLLWILSKVLGVAFGGGGK